MIQGTWVQEALNSLIQRNDSASGKDHHRYDKGPEVQFLAVAKRMRVTVKTIQQQGTAPRVHNRVDAFRKHGGAPGEKRGGKFRGRDNQIGMATRIAFGFWSIAQSVAAARAVRVCSALGFLR
jgi:hypothetical protein